MEPDTPHRRAAVHTHSTTTLGGVTLRNACGFAALSAEQAQPGEIDRITITRQDEDESLYDVVIHSSTHQNIEA